MPKKWRTASWLWISLPRRRGSGWSILEQLTDRHVKNFTSDWKDGTTVAALVDALAPGLCSEYAIMNPDAALENASHAMKLADDWLGIPQVLAPEDMVSPYTDMMTYLSKFPDAKLKPGAPLNNKRLKKGDPAKVKVFGPGVKPTGLDTNMPTTEFTVDPRTAGDGKVTAVVTTPNGPIEVRVEPQKNGTTVCSYVPNAEGDYNVEVKFNGVHVGESPFKVNVAQGVDPSHCVAYGPGVEGGDIRMESPTEFWVKTSGSGKGKMDIVVKGPKLPLLNRDIIVEKESDDKYHVQYTPQVAGPHSVEVMLSGLHIKDSPFRVQVKSDRPDASKCSAEGPGLEENGMEINSETRFDVHTVGAGAPFVPVFVPETDASKVKAHGPGLRHDGVRVGDSGDFIIDTREAVLTMLRKENKTMRKEIDMKNAAIQEMKEAYESDLKKLSDNIREKNTTIQNLSAKLKKYEKSHDSTWMEVSKTSMSWKIDRSTIKKISQKEIGVGAWGKVFSGHYQGEPVAIKYAHMALLEIHGTVDMIKREISIMAHIQHPNLVRFIGAVLDDAVDSKKDVPIIVLELLDMNLRTAYTKELDKITMVSIFCDVAYGLHYLHEQSNPIIHRDVSAPNILLKRLPNRTFKAKISDFGSANLAMQSKTAGAGAIIYTAPEMFPQEDFTADPPEQTVKVDVYSYGIVLLEVVTKEMPAIQKRSLLLRSCKQEWEQIHDLVVRCTQRAPSDRPEMRDILKSIN